MEVVNVADLPWGVSPHHVATRFRDLGTEGATDGVKTLWVEIAPGGRIMLHAHGAEVFFVLEGEGLFTVEREERPVHPGDRIIVPSGQIQGVANTGPTPLRLLAIQPPTGSRYAATKLSDLVRRFLR